MGLAAETLPDQHDRAGWPALRARFAATFATEDARRMVSVFEGTDDVLCAVRPSPRPRGTRMPLRAMGMSPSAMYATRTGPTLFAYARRGAPRTTERGALGREALAEWGFRDTGVDRLVEQGLGFSDV